jgi:sugar lactone lactonase YvrE
MNKSNATSYLLRAALLAAAIHPTYADTLGTTFPLYVANVNGDSIVKLDSSGNQTVFASGNHIQMPFGLAFDSAGSLYVASAINNTIVKLDASGNQTVFASGGSLQGPSGLAFDANDNLYVSNQFGNNIVKVSPSGEQVVFISGGNLQAPLALAFDAVGNLYVTTNYVGGTVVKFDSAGNPTAFSPNRGLSGAQGLALDSAGNLYVSCHTSDNTSHEVFKLDANGKVLGALSYNGQLSGPAHLAFDATGNLYVASDRNSEVVRLDSAGAQVAFSSGENFRTPFGIAFTRLPAGSATITYSGNATGAEVGNWRTSAVKKSRDLDGDNVYGTWGAVDWTHNSYLEGAHWSFSSSGAQSTNSIYALIDDLPSGASSTTAGIALNGFTFTAQGAESDYSGNTLRVGVIEDVLDPAGQAADTFKALQVKQVNGSGDSGVIPLRGGGPGTGKPAMYFFDIYPVHPGESFSILAPNNAGGTSGNAGYLSAVSFDLAKVPQAQYFPSGLNFGGVQQGTTSAARVVTLTNSGTATLVLTGVSITDNFAQTNNCPNSLAPGASCQISVTCAPQPLGAISGSLTISDNSGGVAPQTLALTATGLSTPILSIAPGSLDFGNQQSFTTSAAKTVTLTNSSPASAAPISIPSITITGPFAQTNTCPAALGTGASCQISVTFTPQSAGALGGQIVIKDNASGNPQTIGLTGTGVGTATGTLSPSSVTFAGQQQSTSSGPQTVTLSNTGAAPLLITAISITGAFTQTNNCPATLAPAAACQIAVTFNSPSIGSFTGAVSVTDNTGNAVGSIQTIALSGTGVGIPKVVLSPASVSFPTTLTGQTSTQTVTLSNTGTGPLNIRSIVTQPVNLFNQTNNCGSTLAQGASCQFTITFSPPFGTGYSGLIQMIDNDPSGYQNINLSGAGSLFSITPRNLDFGGVLPGSSSPQTIMIVNGSYQLTFDSITPSSGFTQTNTCRSPLPAGGSCQITVVFKPSSAVAYTGTLTIIDEIPGYVPFTQTIPLTGTAKFATATLSGGASLVFGASSGGVSTQSVTLTNSGNIPLTIGSMTMGGNNPDRFTQTNTCGASVAPGKSCTINITFHAPGGGGILQIGAASAVLTITDNASPGTLSISLTGIAL